MLFAETLAGLMVRPSQDNVPKDDVPWHLKYGVCAVGIVGKFFAVLLGLYNCIGILLGDVGCLVGGIMDFVTLSIKAPCCFIFVDYVRWRRKRRNGIEPPFTATSQIIRLRDHFRHRNAGGGGSIVSFAGLIQQRQR